MDPDRPLASVDQVRDELKRLGYLDSGLDRFVLAGAGARSPLVASFAVAARVGLAGGVLLGSAFALAAASLDRQLLGEPRDLAVLAVYLTVALGLMTALAAFVGGLLAAWRGRAASPTLSRNIGLLVGLAGLAYLVAWWRSHGAGASVAALTTAVVLGLGLSLLLGRFGSLAAVAVLSAGGTSGRLPQASLTRRHMLPLLAGALGLLGGGVAVASYVSGQGRPDAPPFAVVPTGVRVRVLAIDGLERRMVEQRLASGELPHLDALLRSGAHGVLGAEPEQVPAIVWTTVATGRGPEAHGIRSAGTRRLAGMRTPLGLSESVLVRSLGAATDLLRLTRSEPATGVLRGVKAFWNVASDKGLKVGVVNWWATWPADPVNGFVVSDRTFFKLERGEAGDREVHPPEMFARLAQSMPRDDDRARRIDAFAASAAALLEAGGAPDVEAVYLPGLDIVTMQKLGDSGTADVAGLDTRLEAVRAHYRFVDGLIGDAARRLAPSDLLLIVGDPGRLARRSSDPAEGLLVMSGGPAIAADLGTVSERDVAPTVLHLAGLPVSREMAGKVLDAALSADFKRAHPVRSVDSYGRRSPSRPAESAFDREMLEELRSLGYIQ